MLFAYFARAFQSIRQAVTSFDATEMCESSANVREAQTAVTEVFRLLGFCRGSVELFGAFATGLADPTSDVDLAYVQGWV